MSEPTRIGDILVRRELIDSHVLRRALSEQPGKNQRLVSMLINQTLIELDDGALALSELSGYPAVLERDFERRAPELADEIALDLIVKWAVIPLARATTGLLVVCARDPSPMLAHALSEALEEPVALAIGPALYVEKVIRAICKAPPDSAPAFLPGQIDRPPPGWHRRPVAELIEGGIDSPPDPESEPALIVSTLSSEEREVPVLVAPDPSEIDLQLPLPQLVTGSHPGIDVPPSDPATLIPDPAAPALDPSTVPMSWSPDERRHGTSAPPPYGARTITGSSSMIGSVPPPVAEPSLVRQPEIVAQPRITTASSIGIDPPELEIGRRDIGKVQSRHSADQLAIEQASTRWRSVLLVDIAGDVARGNRGRGPRLSNVEKLQLAVATCPLLRAARDTWEMTMTTSRGAVPDPLLELVGLPAAAVPIFDDDRPVAILAVGEPIGELSTAMEELANLATALGGAYYRCR